MSQEAKEIIENFLREYIKQNSSIVYNERSNKNFSISYSSKRGATFAYLDIVDGNVIARLKLNPANSELSNFNGLWRNYTGNHKIGSWTEITEIPIQNEKNFRFYIAIFEIARKENQR